MDETNYRPLNEDPEPLGWNAITEAFEKLYPGQDNPKHFANPIPWRLGGQYPLQGVSVYDGGDFFHFVTYGLTELHCIGGILQDLAKLTFEKGEQFYPNEYIYTGQTTGIDVNQRSALTGFVTALDEAGTIDTPNGKVDFVKLIGAADAELKAILDQKITVQELIGKIGDITDYARDSVI